MTSVTEANTRRRRNLGKSTILLGTLVLGFCLPYDAFVRFYITVNTKDFRYDTAVFVAEVVDKFVSVQDPPRWPSSWSDLATITHETDHYFWPADQRLVERYVVIDFSVSYEEVSGSGWPAKPPISPRGWSRRGWEEAVWGVLKRDDRSG